MLTIHQRDISSEEEHSITLETGRIARQASSVWVSSGKARLLCTVSVSREYCHGDFLPLFVHYQEKAAAYGKFPGGFVKREGKGNDREILTSRLIDRAIRPLITQPFFHEIQVICTLYSADDSADYALMAMHGASAAMMMAPVPFAGPVAATRVHDDTVDCVIAGNSDGVVMIDMEGKNVPLIMLKKIFEDTASQRTSMIKEITSFVQEVQATTHHKSPIHYDHRSHEQVIALIDEKTEGEWHALWTHNDHSHEYHSVFEMKQKVCYALHTEQNIPLEKAYLAFHDVWKRQMRSFIVQEKRRMDYRSYDTIRSIDCHVGLLPSPHGSALFTRGNTQVLASVTLGGKEEAQWVDEGRVTVKDHFLLHYNFPPFSVGETGKIGAPGRREIGHGKLAHKGVAGVLDIAGFSAQGRTIRVVADVTESSGSSSMATVCATTLALMDAGIPLTDNVAGMAMGAITAQGERIILTDISGLEDHIGDMDFKIVGTIHGVTALQMDLKEGPIDHNFFSAILEEGHKAVGRVLHIMQKQTLDVARSCEKHDTPCWKTTAIDPTHIRDLIGPGGRNIRDMAEKTHTKIEVADNGTVTVFSSTGEKNAEDAIKKIHHFLKNSSLG